MSAAEDVMTKALAEHGQAVGDYKKKTDGEVKSLHEKNEELNARVLELEQRAGQPRGEGGLVGGAPTNPFAALFRHERLNQFRDGLPSTGRIEFKADLGMIQKALTSLQGSGATPAAGYPVEPQRFAGVYENPMRPLRLLDVLRKITVSSSNTFEFARMTDDALNNNAAAYQASEGAIKAEGGYDADLTSVYINTFAHFDCSLQTSPGRRESAAADARRPVPLSSAGVLRAPGRHRHGRRPQCLRPGNRGHRQRRHRRQRGGPTRRHWIPAR